MKKIYLIILLLSALPCFCQEVCDNGIDDDGDGLIDLNDDECICNDVQSIIPNPSFEEFDMCPNWYSQMNYCVAWMQASNPTTDFMHSCNYVLSAVTEAGLADFPDGNGIASGMMINEWSEYLGVCLDGSMEAGADYQLTFHVASLPVSGGDLSACTEPGVSFEPVDITLYGSTNCNTLPLPTSGAPSLASPDWVILGSVYYNPMQSWTQVTINFTPSSDINAIMIGGPEVLPPSYSGGMWVPYFLYDNVLLNKTSEFGANISESGDFCNGDLILAAVPTVPLSNTATYQWYINGIAIAGATYSTYEVLLADESVGNYTVKIIDGADCLVTPSHNVGGMLPQVETVTIVPTCYENGTITIVTEAVLYSFDNGMTWSTDNTATDLEPGMYHIRVQSEAGCISVTTTVLFDYPDYAEFSTYFTTSPAICGPTGSIVIMSDATEFSFDGGETWGTDPVLDNIPGGFYNIRLRDADGCVSWVIPVLVGQSSLPPPEYSYVQPDCFGQNGSVTITTPAAEYSFDEGLTWGTTPSLTGLSGGDFWLMIKDENGCISEVSFISLYPQYLDSPVYIMTQGCTDNGSITITTAAHEYSINNGTTWSSTPEFTNLSPGIYQIVVRNEDGCESYVLWVWLDPIIMQYTPEYEYVAPDCNQSGSITIESPGYEYSFNNGGSWTTNNVMTDLVPDHHYAIIVKDSDGCQSLLADAYVPPMESVEAPDAITIQPDCEEPEGSIAVTTAAYEYSFDNGATWSSSGASGPLAGGTYMVMTRTQTGCESPATEVAIGEAIEVPDAPEISITDPTCTVATASITINTVAAFYSFDNGNTWGTANTLDNAVPGTYYIQIKNEADGCGSPAIEAVISPESGPTPLPDVTDEAYCQGDIPTTLTATGTNLLWYDSPAGGTGSSEIPIPSASTPGTTVYYVTQTLNGCESGRAAITVTIWPTPQPPAGDDLEYCEGDVTTALTATGTNLLWYDAPAGGTGTATPPLPSSQAPGTFVYYVSQTINGCESDRTAISVLINPVPDAPQTEAVITYEHMDITVALTAVGTNLTWYDSDMDILNSAPIPSSASIGSTTYYVTLAVNGCEGPPAEITVVITPDYVEIDYPKFFSPNGDSLRDTWNIFTPEHGVKAVVEIYDRYGKIITVLKAPGAGWDGTYNGRNLPATDYWFKVVYKEYGIEKEFKAHFSLLR